MSAASEPFGDCGDVKLPLAAETDAIAATAEFTKESRNFDTLNSERIIH
jgi:hypothetical protein